MQYIIYKPLLVCGQVTTISKDHYLGFPSMYGQTQQFWNLKQNINFPLEPLDGVRNKNNIICKQ